MTAQWEHRLKQVELGKLTSDEFMNDITNYVEDLVVDYKGKIPQKEVIGTCPFCGKNVYENQRTFYCEGYQDIPSCTFTLWKNHFFFQNAKKEFTKELAA